MAAGGELEGGPSRQRVLYGAGKSQVAEKWGHEWCAVSQV